MAAAGRQPAASRRRGAGRQGAGEEPVVGDLDLAFSVATGPTTEGALLATGEGPRLVAFSAQPAGRESVAPFTAPSHRAITWIATPLLTNNGPTSQSAVNSRHYLVSAGHQLTESNPQAHNSRSHFGQPSVRLSPPSSKNPSASLLPPSSFRRATSTSYILLCPSFHQLRIFTNLDHYNQQHCQT